MIITRAPLRIPLGGGGTDFATYYKEHGGYILGFACNLYVYVVVHSIMEPKINLKYSKNESVDCSLEGLDQLSNRVAAEAIKYIGLPTTGGLEIATFSDVPESSGLGGSSSFTCALLMGLNELAQKDSYTSDKLFSDAFHVERELAAIPGGMQDQFFASKGGASTVLLGSEQWEELSGTSEIDLTEFVRNLYLVFTNKVRPNLDIATRQNEKTEQSNEDMLTSLAKVKEIGRSIENYIYAGKFREVADLFTEHWDSKMRRDPDIATEEMQAIWEDCMNVGALGGKLIGLGGGGYFLMYSEKDLDSVGGLHLDINYTGTEIVHKSERQVEVYA